MTGALWRFWLLLLVISWPIASADAQAPAIPAAVAPSDGSVTAKTSAEKTDKKLSVTGDFRYRFEHDWDSKFDDGTERLDRFRMRYRLRAGFTYQMDPYVTFGARARTGVPTNMQSPHFNVGYNSFLAGAFNLDKAYARVKYRDHWAWAGRNSFPLWKQNELFWDDDVTPAGVAAGTKLTRGKVTVRPTAAFFVADHEQVLAYEDGRIGAAQLRATIKASDKVTVDLASAYMRMVRIFIVPQHLGGMDRLNYKIVMSSARVTAKLFQPLAIGLDHVINLEDYDNNDKVPDHYKDQKTGFVASVKLGKAKSKGDWQVGYWFAYKQRHSMVSYYVEDDWVRWGNIHRNRNINYQGHELRAVYVIGKKLNAMLRFYTVEGIQPRIENNPMAVPETGDRVRLDFNYGF